MSAVQSREHAAPASEGQAAPAAPSPPSPPPLAHPPAAPAPPQPAGQAAPSEIPPMPPQPLPSPPDIHTLLRATAPLHPHIHPRPAAPARPPTTSERIDERCWTSSRQTNARRALGREPTVKMYCYINMRNALSDLVPVPGHPTAFLARDAPPASPAAEAAAHHRKARVPPEGVPEYHWPWLEGRYFYVATGRENVARHMLEMSGASAEATEEKKMAKQAEEGATREKAIKVRPDGSVSLGEVQRLVAPRDEHVGAWDTIRRIEERCEKKAAERLLPGKREEAMIRRAMGLEEESSEKLISLSDVYSSTLQRLHAHLVRIYSPGLRNLARLPQVWTDGTTTQMLDTVQTRLTDGSAFRLYDRLRDSLGSVRGQLEERRKRREERERGDDVGFGGTQPPLPPTLFPPPPPGPRGPDTSEGGGSGDAGAGAGEGGSEPPTAPPAGRRDPPRPREVVISCTVM
ncbi:uncharacterized protein JCM10292_000211 [Rhodotorula paludigena]|uniref:uncharacterized protein n=1 Tax=Rhodotorula paludigena TaxID=86838 RepID=UPI00316E7B86